MKLGAYDYITKPFKLDNVKITVEKALERASLQKEVEQTRQRLKDQYGYARIVGESPAMREVFEMVKLIAESDATTVLLQGESGTGKDLIAKAIHYQSQRFEKPFLEINCAAVPDTLIESELMGHEKGAFTDAKTKKIGLLEEANGGTVFLDEIGDTSLDIQVKLLRVIEDKAFRRVGGVSPIKVNIRLITATNQDLETMVLERRFRPDLYYRLKVFPINLPPLRDRGEDIILLSKYFIDQYNQEFKKEISGMSPEVEELLMAYPWPGNVRELKNAIERAMILTNDNLIRPEHLPKELQRDALEEAAGDAQWVRQIPQDTSLEDIEEAIIRHALEVTDGNQIQAARLLKISRHTLRYRMKRYGLL
jgi:DNA-binding NtrC family response regulator